MNNKILLKIEYRGTRYSGWQRQLNSHSIQQVIEDALSVATGAQVTIHGSGRTDKGVHALSQYAHFVTESSIPPDNYAYMLNNLLPQDIRIIYSQAVAADFHARFCATAKTYRYLIWSGLAGSAIRHDTHHIVRTMPDIPLMREAAKHLLGTHDFVSFSTKGSNPSSTIRTVTDITISPSDPYPDSSLSISVSGNAFLYNMVRVIAAQLLRVGYGIIPPARPKEALALKDRHYAKESAPACGLYLAQVVYPPVYGID